MKTVPSNRESYIGSDAFGILLKNSLQCREVIQANVPIRPKGLRVLSGAVSLEEALTCPRDGALWAVRSLRRLTSNAED